MFCEYDGRSAAFVCRNCGRLLCKRCVRPAPSADGSQGDRPSDDRAGGICPACGGRTDPLEHGTDEDPAEKPVTRVPESAV